MKRLKWPPYNKDNYIEYDAKNPTIENGLVIELKDNERAKATGKKAGTNKESR